MNDTYVQYTTCVSNITDISSHYIENHSHKQETVKKNACTSGKCSHFKNDA